MTPLEAAARNLVRQDYFRHGHQPSGAVEGYVDAEWPARLDDARAVLEAIRGGNFKGFLERIFIVRDGDWKDRGPVTNMPEDDGAYEFSIARK